jgi:hypothetical protein
MHNIADLMDSPTSGNIALEFSERALQSPETLLPDTYTSTEETVNVTDWDERCVFHGLLPLCQRSHGFLCCRSVYEECYSWLRNVGFLGIDPLDTQLQEST